MEWFFSRIVIPSNIRPVRFIIGHLTTLLAAQNMTQCAMVDYLTLNTKEFSVILIGGASRRWWWKMIDTVTFPRGLQHSQLDLILSGSGDDTPCTHNRNHQWLDARQRIRHSIQQQNHKNERVCELLWWLEEDGRYCDDCRSSMIQQ